MKARIEETVREMCPPVSERHQVHIVNPAAGRGRLLEAVRRAIADTAGEIRESAEPGDVTRLVRELFEAEPYAHAVVYGGDGTVFEAVNGIMQSGAGRTASFSVIPAGSGNDFSTHANDSGLHPKSVIAPIDVIRTVSDGVERYYANMMNIGFDCSVVAQTLWLKEKTFLRGSAAYIGGVAKELFVKKTTDVAVEFSGCVNPADNSALPDLQLKQKMLLTAVGNGSCCGGGFHALPLAALDDGYMDALVVNDVSRPRFVALVGDYRAGTYVNEKGELKERFRSVLRFVRCRKMRITGPERFCLDGEIFPTGAARTIKAEVLPRALNYVPL